MDENITETSNSVFDIEEENIRANNSLLLEILLSILPQPSFTPSIKDLVENANSIVQQLQITPQKITIPQPIFTPSIKDLVENANRIVQELQITPQEIIIPKYIFNPSILELVQNANRIVQELQITPQKITIPQPIFTPSILELVQNVNRIVQQLQITPQKITLPTYTFKPSIRDLIENAMFIFREMLLPEMDPSEMEFNEDSLPNRYILSSINKENLIVPKKHLVKLKKLENKDKENNPYNSYEINTTTYKGDAVIRPNKNSEEGSYGESHVKMNDVKISAMKAPQNYADYNGDNTQRDNYIISYNKPVVNSGTNKLVTK